MNLVSNIYDLDKEYDEDVINAKKLLAALTRNITEENAPVLAELLGLELPQLSKALHSLDHIDIMKW